MKKSIVYVLVMQENSEFSGVFGKFLNEHHESPPEGVQYAQWRSGNDPYRQLRQLCEDVSEFCIPEELVNENE